MTYEQLRNLVQHRFPKHICICSSLHLQHRSLRYCKASSGIHLQNRKNSINIWTNEGEFGAYRIFRKTLLFVEPMRGSRKFFQRGSNSDNLFFFLFCTMRGERIQIPHEADHYHSTSEPPLSGPMMTPTLNAGFEAL